MLKKLIRKLVDHLYWKYQEEDNWRMKMDEPIAVQVISEGELEELRKKRREQIEKVRADMEKWQSVKNDAEKYFTALKSIASKRFPDDSYSIGSYQESSVCVEQGNGSWIVFNGEKGNRYNKKWCITPLETCLTFFRYLTRDAAVLYEMEEELIDLVRHKNGNN